MQSQSFSQSWHSQSWRDANHLVPILVFVVAALIGVILGRGQWLWFVALSVFAVVLLWPVQLGLGTFALLCPFDMVLFIGGRGGRSTTTLVGILAALALFTRAVFTRRLQSPPKVAYWLTGLVAWSALTWLWALQPKITLEYLPSAFGLLTLFVAATCLQISEEELAWVNRMALIGGCAAAIYVCYTYSNNSFYGFYAAFSRRASMMLGHDLEADPNYFAASLLLPLSIAFSGFLTSRKRLAKLLMLAAVVIIGLAIFLTKSRGALVALLVMIVVFLYRMRINWRAVVALASLGGLIAFLPSDFFTRVEGAVATHGAGRLDIWVVGLHMLGRYGIFGVGLRNFPIAYSDFAGYAPLYRGPAPASHNTLLNVSVELGVFGLLLFLGLIVSEARVIRAVLSRAVRGQQSRVIAYEAAFWSLLASALFLDVLWRKDLWLILILLAIATRNSEKSDPALGVVSSPQFHAPEGFSEQVPAPARASGQRLPGLQHTSDRVVPANPRS
jgi:O-antigen ligase